MLLHRLPQERNTRIETDRSFDGPIWVGANPTNPKLFRGPQIRDAELEELRETWLTPEGELRFYMAHVVDPSEFYVYPLRKDGICVRDEELKTLTENLDDFYSQKGNQRILDVSTLVALGGGERMFGMLDEGLKPGSDTTGIWHRVEICGERFVGSGGFNARLRHKRQGWGRRGEPEDVGRISVKLRHVDWGGAEWKLISEVFAIDER